MFNSLRDHLENTERRREYLPKMDVTSLPAQGALELAPLGDHLLEPLDSQVIRGNVCDELWEEGRVDEIVVGIDQELHFLNA